jgi:hypothetical protein
MKKFFFAVAAVALSVAFTSCGGGWTEESKKSYNETCTSMMEIVYPDDAKTICDCYVNKLAEKYPKADMTPDQASTIMDECSADAKKKADEAFEKQMNDMVNSMDTTATEATEAAEGAMEAH